jgi:hypothetical protein
MFTDFVDECRAERLKGKTSVDASTIRREKELVSKEAAGLTAVAA